jgi:putative aldouronate transport system substrate-binding protein
MQYRTKKTAATLLASVTVLSMALVGCGKSEPTKESPANSVRATSSSVPSSKPVLEPVELSIYYPGTEQKDKAAVEEELNKLLKDKINATVKINAIDWGKLEPKNQPDVCFRRTV